MAMDGLNCGMQVQTRTCTSGTWDACTSEDMKQVLPCNDPDKEIEGCGKIRRINYLLCLNILHSSSSFIISNVQN